MSLRRSLSRPPPRSSQEPARVSSTIPGQRGKLAEGGSLLRRGPQLRGSPRVSLLQVVRPSTSSTEEPARRPKSLSPIGRFQGRRGHSDELAAHTPGEGPQATVAGRRPREPAVRDRPGFGWPLGTRKEQRRTRPWLPRTRRAGPTRESGPSPMPPVPVLSSRPAANELEHVLGDVSVPRPIRPRQAQSTVSTSCDHP